MKSPEGGENEGKKTISGLRNKDTRLPYHRGYKIQRDSTPKRVGKCQISGRKSYRLCFARESWRFIWKETELSQVSVINTKGGGCSASAD